MSLSHFTGDDRSDLDVFRRQKDRSFCNTGKKGAYELLGICLYS